MNDVEIMEVIYLGDNTPAEEVKDWCEATQEQRSEALQALLQPYCVEFRLTHVERLGNVQKKTDLCSAREHYAVSVGTSGRDKKVELFTFFQGATYKAVFGVSEIVLRQLPRNNKQNEKYRTDRFLSFWYCIASDYQMMHNHDIQDALDLIEQGLCTNAQSARETYTALRGNFDKCNKIIGSKVMAQILNIMEGY